MVYICSFWPLYKKICRVCDNNINNNNKIACGILVEYLKGNSFKESENKLEEYFCIAFTFTIINYTFS